MFKLWHQYEGSSEKSSENPKNLRKPTIFCQFLFLLYLRRILNFRKKTWSQPVFLFWVCGVFSDFWRAEILRRKRPKRSGLVNLWWSNINYFYEVIHQPLQSASISMAPWVGVVTSRKENVHIRGKWVWWTYEPRKRIRAKEKISVWTAFPANFSVSNEYNKIFRFFPPERNPLNFTATNKTPTHSTSNLLINNNTSERDTQSYHQHCLLIWHGYGSQS